MAYQNRHPVSGGVRDIIDISDLEDMDSITGVDVAQQTADNRRLAQAVNYIQSEGGEGGSDSPATFIDRVNQIDRALLNRLPRPGHKVDGDLYHQVQTMVRNVQRDFEDAAEEPVFDPEREDDIPEGFVPIEPLYRGESSSPSPTPTPVAPRAVSDHTSGPRRHGVGENIQRTRVFKYGGPGGEAEHWHSNAPSSLPFPETFLMAHWESLKIDYDLSRPKDAKHTETNVTFEHPALQPYLNLPQYESGSRFKLPDVSAEVQNAISRYGTSDQLAKTVEELSKLDASEDNEKDYAPRIFLEKFRVGEQRFPTIVSPSQLRKAMAYSPSKCRTAKFTSQAPIPATNLPTTTPRVTKVPVPKPKTPQTKPHASPAFRCISNEVRLAEKADSRAAHKTSSSPPLVSKPKPAPKPTKVLEPRTIRAAPSAPKTKFKSSPPKAFTPKPPPPVTHVLIPKRPRGRPRKDAATATPTVAEPIATSLGKRKPSIGSQPYHEPTPASSSKRRQKVAAVEEEEIGARVVKKTVIRKKVVVEKKESKATKAGKLTKKDGGKKVKEVKFTESVGRGTTRSGVEYGI